MMKAILYLPLFFAFQASCQMLSKDAFEIDESLFVIFGLILFFAAKGFSEISLNLEKYRLIDKALYEQVERFGQEGFKKLALVLSVFTFVYAECALVFFNEVSAFGYFLLALFAWGHPRRFYLKRFFLKQPLLNWFLGGIFCFFLVWFTVGTFKALKAFSNDAVAYGWMLYGGYLGFTMTLGVDPNSHPMLGSMTQRFGAMAVIRLLLIPAVAVIGGAIVLGKGVEAAFLTLLFSLFWALYYARPALHKYLSAAAYLYFLGVTLLGS